MKFLNHHSKGFKSILRISNTNHQNYTTEIIMFDYFSLQYMLIYNEFISVQILIDISITDYTFINSFFTYKH